MDELSNDHMTTRRDRVALGWFGLGLLVGAVVALGVISLTNMPRSATTTNTAPAAQTDLRAIREAAMLGVKDAMLAANTGTTSTVSLEDIRNAARQGATEALANAQLAAGQAPVAEPTPVPVDPSTIVARPANTLGESSAKITIVEYSDFQCPFCKRFHDQVLQRVLDEYVKTGKVKLTFKHFAFLGEESRWSAQTSECAAEQGKFWDMHELLFKRQNGENQGTFTKDKLALLADEAKLDSKKYAACMDNPTIAARVQEDAAEGNRVGVRGTPSFLINGKLLVGAQPFEAFKIAVEDALKTAQ